MKVLLPVAMGLAVAGLTVGPAGVASAWCPPPRPPVVINGPLITINIVNPTLNVYNIDYTKVNVTQINRGYYGTNGNVNVNVTKYDIDRPVVNLGPSIRRGQAQPGSALRSQVRGSEIE